MATLALPSTSHAGIFSVFPANSAEDPIEEIRADDALFVIGTTDLGGGELCVIPADTAIPSDNSLSCDGAGVDWASTNHVSGIGSFIIPLQGPKLRLGTWRILGDGQCLEFVAGICVTPSTDAVSQPFIVVPCGPDCDTSIAEATLAQWKQRAGGELGTATTFYCVAGTVWNNRPDVSGAIKNYRSARRTGDWVEDAIEDKSELVGDVAEGGITFFGFGFLQYGPALLDIPTSYNEAVLSMATDIVCKQRKMLQDIEDDPPDPNYQTVQPPQFEQWASSFNPAGDRLIDAAEDVHAYRRAQLKAVERYQGALAADDQPFVRLQAQAIADQGDHAVDAIRRMIDALEEYRLALLSAPEGTEPILTPEDLSTLTALFQRVRTAGFNDAELAELRGLGLTDAMIDFYRSTYERPIEEAPTGTSAAQLTQRLIAALESSIESVQALSNDAAYVAALTDPGEVVAVDDGVTTAEDTPATVDVLANDSGSGTLTVVDHTTGSDGSVLCTTAGSCTYHPNVDFHGSDSFTYTVEDSAEQSATATVRVTVTPVNDEPRLVGDNLELAPGVSSGVVDMLANDAPGPANEAAQSLTFDGITFAPTHGTVELVTEGSDAGKLRYTPDPGFGGTDFFDYRACDDGTTNGVADPRCSIASVSIRVRSNPPVAQDDELTTDEDVPVTRDIVANDTDPDGDELVIDFSSRFPEAEHGLVRCDDGRSCTYTPDPEFSGQDGWTYRVADTAGETAEAQVTVTVRAVNDPPRVKDERFATPRDTAGELDVLANDHEVEGSPLRVTGSTDGAHGTSSCSEAGRCTFTPEPGYTGPDTFTYTVSDDEGATTEGRVSVVVMLAAQPSGVLDSKGTDFWLAFPSNFGFGDLSFFLTGDHSTSATVEAPATSPPFSRDVVVNQGDVTTVPVPNDAQLRDLIGESIQVDRAVRIRSEREITAYGLNYISATTDAYLGLPTDVLGTEYLALGWRNGTPRFGWHVSELAVVATQDGTAITVQQPGGEPRNAQLDAGDVFTLNLAEDGDDISGTSVLATKPVAVFSGNLCANIPTDVGFCDHVVEQMPPTSTWGTRFVTAPLATRTKGDLFRILASADDTTVTIDGEEVAQLDRGELHEQLIEGPASIVADKPVLVAQFSNGSGFDDCPESRCDPFMMLIPPYEQFLSSYTVTTPASGYRDNFINIVVAQTGMLGVRLDGQPVPAARFNPVGSSGFAYAQLPVTTGTHVVEGARPFGAFVYGFDFFDSYGYPGGLSLAPIAQAETVELSPASAERAVGAEACVTATVTDASGAGLRDIRVDFEVTGANPQTAFATTDAAGEARYCYTGERAGEDTIRAAVGAIAATATVSWTADQPNRPPTATDLSVETDEDRAVDITLAGSDPDGDPLTIAVASLPAHGTLTGSGGALTYTPSANFNGSDSFAFSVSDGKGGADVGTVSISVKPVNDPPVASDDELSTDEDTPVTVQASALLANDPDVDGDALLLTAVSDAEHGTVELVGDAVTFRPAPAYHGPASFRYSVSDGNGGTASAGVAVTVRSVNDRPSATDVSVETDEDDPANITLAGSDADGDSLTFAVASPPAHGTLTGAGTTRTYTPDPGFHGTDTFTYTASDGTLTSVPATVTITVRHVDDAPIATDADITTAEDTPVDFSFTASDPDGDALGFDVVDEPEHGTLTGSGATRTYTPDADYHGSDRVTFRANDGSADSNLATVSITVTPVNDAPVPSDDELSTDEDTPVTVQASALLANDLDVDGDALSLTAVSDNEHGRVELAGGAVTFTPAPDYHGPASFRYSVSDGSGGSDSASVAVTIRSVNDAPRAADMAVATDQDTPVDVTLAASDPDGDSLTLQIVGGPAHGTLSGSGATRTYTPNAGYDGPDSFTFRVSDGQLDSNPATVSITVRAVQLAPIALVIDEDSIDNGSPPNFFSATAVNDRIARIGRRTPLPAFAGSNVGRDLFLHTGKVGGEGWLALKTIPPLWAAAGPTTDGLVNYFRAGPGLGSGSRPETLLDNVPDVTPLRATGLGQLLGESVCAVVYDNDVSVNYGPLRVSLKGANLGVVAFTVQSVSTLTGYSSSSLPKLGLEVLDAGAHCGGSLRRLTSAPAPISSSKPFDVVPFGPG